MIKISIITVTYNSAATLRDTFDSILRQTYKNIEYLVVDGGSKDDTIAITKEYEPRFEGRMRWVSEKDNGLYDAINKGISMATGDIIGLLNSDDFFTRFDVLSTIANEFEQHPDIDAVYGDVHYVEEKNTDHIIRYYSSRRFKTWKMRMGFMPAHPSFYCKKSCYERFALPSCTGGTNKIYYKTDYQIASDFEFLLRMLYVGNISTHYIQKDFVTMRVGGISSSGLHSHIVINRDHKRAFKENHIRSNVFLRTVRYITKVFDLLAAIITY